jgi:hypothetical protein
MAFLLLAPRVVMFAARTPIGRRVAANATRAVSNTLRQHHLMPRVPQLPRILPRVHIPTPRLPPGLTHAAHVVRTQANAVQHAATAAARTQARRAGARILQTAHRVEHAVDRVERAADRVQHAQDLHAALVGPGPAAAPPTPLDTTGPASTQGQPAPLPAPDPGDMPAHAIEPTRVYNQDHSKDLPPETHQHTDPHADPPAPTSGLSTPVIALAVLGGGAALFYLLRSPTPVPAT